MKDRLELALLIVFVTAIVSGIAGIGISGLHSMIAKDNEAAIKNITLLVEKGVSPEVSYCIVNRSCVFNDSSIGGK